jgi:hypothetical protein
VGRGGRWKRGHDHKRERETGGGRRWEPKEGLDGKGKRGGRRGGGGGERDLARRDDGVAPVGMLPHELHKLCVEGSGAGKERCGGR